MLVLSRKQDQSLTIGSETTIRIIRVSNGHVRLGITAPPSIRVLRDDAHRTEPADTDAQRTGHDCTLAADHSALCEACHGMLGRLGLAEARIARLEQEVEWLRRCCRDTPRVRNDDGHIDNERKDNQ